jgi:hypothetical protein
MNELEKTFFEEQIKQEKPKIEAKKTIKTSNILKKEEDDE